MSAAIAAGVALVVGAAFLVGPGVDKALDAVSSSLCVLLFPGVLLSFQVGLRLLGEGQAQVPRLRIAEAIAGQIHYDEAEPDQDVDQYAA